MNSTDASRVLRVTLDEFANRSPVVIGFVSRSVTWIAIAIMTTISLGITAGVIVISALACRGCL